MTGDMGSIRTIWTGMAGWALDVVSIMKEVRWVYVRCDCVLTGWYNGATGVDANRMGIGQEGKGGDSGFGGCQHVSSDSEDECFLLWPHQVLVSGRQWQWQCGSVATTVMRTAITVSDSDGSWKVV